MRVLSRIGFLLSTFALVVVLTAKGWGAQPASKPSPNDTTDKTEANITLVTAGFLEHSQLAHHPLDTELAGKFLDRYLDELDGSRSLLLQSDLKEFARYRATLAEAIYKDGDTSAAHAIFARYLERQAQKVAYVSELLRTTKFDFTGHDVYAFDREHAERPRDVQAAEKIWRQQVRAEYLQEKLAGKAGRRTVHPRQSRTQPRLPRHP